MLALLAYLASAVFLGAATFGLQLVDAELAAGLFCLVLGVLLERVTIPVTLGEL